LAAAAHNTAIALIVDSFQGPLLMSLARAKDVAPRMGRQGAREHRKLVEAIRRRDVDEAHDLMTKHLGRTAARLHGTGSSSRGRP
jgi:DNA-binding FadR family transcriptional regulator